MAIANSMCRLSLLLCFILFPSLSIPSPCLCIFELAWHVSSFLTFTDLHQRLPLSFLSLPCLFSLSFLPRPSPSSFVYALELGNWIRLTLCIQQQAALCLTSPLPSLFYLSLSLLSPSSISPLPPSPSPSLSLPLSPPPSPLPLTCTSQDPSDGGRCDSGFAFANKPSEAVLQQYWHM